MVSGPRNLNEHIMPLNMNGLQGRMLYLPAPKNKNRQILLIYGHHASLERWLGLAEDLNQYGAVTMPDLPGFGGMQSFYKINEKPTIDNMADYLAAFIKMRYKNKTVTIAAMSFGFVVVTRMLQRYPDLTKKVNLLISVAGFAHYDDFTFSKPRLQVYRYAAGLFTRRSPSLVFKNIALHPSLLRLAYSHTHNAKYKFAGATKAEKQQLMDFEVHLWHINDVRTFMSTTVQMLYLNNCIKRVDLPVWHIAVSADNYFNNHIIEQHMRIIFNGFHKTKSKMPNHAPTMIDGISTATPLIPSTIRRLLSRKVA